MHETFSTTLRLVTNLPGPFNEFTYFVPYKIEKDNIHSTYHVIPRYSQNYRIHFGNLSSLAFSINTVYLVLPTPLFPYPYMRADFPLPITINNDNNNLCIPLPSFVYSKTTIEYMFPNLKDKKRMFIYLNKNLKEEQDGTVA